MNENEDQFSNFLNQYMNGSVNNEMEQAVYAAKMISKIAYTLYTENIDNGFDEDKAMEITLKFVEGVSGNNGGN